MGASATELIVYRVRRTHHWLLEWTRAASPDEIAWQPVSGVPSIGFHAWHVGRWADRLQAHVPAMTEELGRRLGPGQEVWQADRVAGRWGWEAEDLGFGQTGMGLADDHFESLPLPAKADLLAYIERAVAAADRSVAAVDARLVEVSCIDLYGERTTVGTALMSHISHAIRHLGMIECLRGILSARGRGTV